MEAGPRQVRVLVVSASPYTRYVISGELSSEPDFFVVGTARTAEEIKYKAALLRPDLVVADLESPRDLADLEETLTETKLPVLALCSQTQDGAELAFSALEAGVVDVVARSRGGLGKVSFMPGLVGKVRAVSGVKRQPDKWQWGRLKPQHKASPRRFLHGDRLVVISASTGGIGPLVELLMELPADLNASLLILSPLPDCYLRHFARRIGPATAFYLQPVYDGSHLSSGLAYVAACDLPLAVGPRGSLTLARDLYEKEPGYSIDRTLSALATRYGPAVVAVILSGFGCDGVQGTLDVRCAGGKVIVQDTTTCLSDETPKAVIEAGAATTVLPPGRIVEEIVRTATQT